MIGALAVGMALAVGPDAFPLVAEVGCPAEGLCRVEVPSELVAAGPDGWLVVDAGGATVPYATLSSSAVAPLWREARLTPTRDPGVIAIDGLDGQPASSVELRVWGWPEPVAARVLARGADGEDWRAGPWELLLGDVLRRAEHPSLQVPDGAQDALRIELSVRDATRMIRGARLALRSPEVLEPARVPLSVGRVSAGPGGVTLAELAMPGPGRVTALDVAVDGDVFERDLALLVWRAEGGGLAPVPQARGTLKRLMVGDARVDRTRIDGLDVSASRLALRIEDGLNPPLDVTGATAHLARRVLLLRDAGPVQLYGGDEEFALRFDLQLAAAELARAEATEGAVGPVRSNPAYRGLEDDLLAPGAALPLERFRFSRDVTGEGVVRLLLPWDVLAVVSSDLRDLRLLDAEGRQLPYVIDNGAAAVRLDGVTDTRDAVGPATRVTVTLPTPTPPLGHLVLLGRGRGFSRSVTVTDAIGGYVWSGEWTAGEGAAQRIVIPLGGLATTQLVVEVDHGDAARPTGPSRCPAPTPTPGCWPAACSRCPSPRPRWAPPRRFSRHRRLLPIGSRSLSGSGWWSWAWAS